MLQKSILEIANTFILVINHNFLCDEPILIKDIMNKNPNIIFKDGTLLSKYHKKTTLA